MGHYWSEMRGDPTPLEIKQGEARDLVRKLLKYPSDKFTVGELGLLLKCDWSNVKSDYWENECDEIFKIANRVGLSK